MGLIPDEACNMKLINNPKVRIQIQSFPKLRAMPSFESGPPKHCKVGGHSHLHHQLLLWYSLWAHGNGHSLGLLQDWMTGSEKSEIYDHGCFL